MKQEYDHDIKLVVVGDPGVGKTSLLVSYTHNYFPVDYIPTVFEHYTANVVWSMGKNDAYMQSNCGSSPRTPRRSRPLKLFQMSSRRNNNHNNNNNNNHRNSHSTSNNDIDCNTNGRQNAPMTPTRINNMGIGVGQRLDDLAYAETTPSNDDLIVRLSLWDTAGQEDYDKLRPMSYPHTNVFMLCYSTVDPETVKNLERKWIPEIRQHAPEAPIILIGTKIDMREHRSVVLRMNEKRMAPLTREDGLQLVRDLKLDGFMECSALTKRGLMEAFDECIAAVVCPRDRKAAKRFKRRNKSSKKKPSWKKACTLM